MRFGKGLRLYDGRIFKLYEHLDRLHRSAAALSFAEIPPNKKIVAEIKRTLAANEMRDGVHIRLTLTRGVKITSGMDPRLNQSGPTLIVLAEHKAPVYAKSGLSLITSKMRRPPPEVLDPQIHHANLLNSILAKIEANDAGADDALMLDLSRSRRGNECDPSFHRAARRSRDQPGRGLPGRNHARDCPGDLRRSRKFQQCETFLTMEDIYKADEVFCTGTMGELAGVTKVDDRIIGEGTIGPMTTRLSELYSELTKAEGIRVVG